MSEVLKQILYNCEKGIPQERVEGILQFYDLVVKENEIQNLTRLITPQDFYFGHVQDVMELLKTQWVGYPALDMGSGVGIPGILAALLEKGDWILSESEKRKAEYLETTTKRLSLDKQITVFSGRAEDYLKSKRVETVVARAVGSVERIYSWIRGCSTWNTLILFKGPGWEEEWKSFQGTKYKNELKVLEEHAYRTGPEGDLKTRKILKIARVPRGTLSNQARIAAE